MSEAQTRLAQPVRPGLTRQETPSHGLCPGVDVGLVADDPYVETSLRQPVRTSGVDIGI